MPSKRYASRQSRDPVGCTHSWSPPPSDSLTSLEAGRALRHFTSERAIRQISPGCFDTNRISDTNKNTIPAHRWTNYVQNAPSPLHCAFHHKKLKDFRMLKRLTRRRFGKRDCGEKRQWCPEADSNHRHADFQSAALPTELSGPAPANEKSRSGFHESTVGAP